MNPMGDQMDQQAASEPEVFLLYEGGKVAEALRSKLTHVRVAPQVAEIPDDAFSDCKKLVDVQLNEGLQVIGERAFYYCVALRSVTVPSTVTELGEEAFNGCYNLTELQLNEGLMVIGSSSFADCTALRSVTLPSTITKLGTQAFYYCYNLVEVQFKKGLQIIDEWAFQRCSALQKVTVPSSVTELGEASFTYCISLVEVQLNEGRQSIGRWAFQLCRALRSVTIPATVTTLGDPAFGGCSNLSEVILLGGERLLNQELIARGSFSEEQGLLNQGALDGMLFDDERNFAFRGCPLPAVKISITWALSERMARLPPECRVSVEERIQNQPRLELLQDGNVLVCFPVVDVSIAPDVEAEDDSDTDPEDIFNYDIQDANLETARSLYRVLQTIAFHELKESSILLELAVWKSRIDGAMSVPRADCRVAIPDPAKSSIMEYCGFAGFLEPAIEGADLAVGNEEYHTRSPSGEARRAKYPRI